MTEKLGVLLVDVPEPMLWKYTYVELDDDINRFSIKSTDTASMVSAFAFPAAPTLPPLCVPKSFIIIRELWEVLCYEKAKCFVFN